MGGEEGWCGHISEMKGYKTDGTTIHMRVAENRNTHTHMHRHTVSQDTEETVNPLFQGFSLRKACAGP